jgi:hypothetical protein
MAQPIQPDDHPLRPDDETSDLRYDERTTEADTEHEQSPAKSPPRHDE